MSKIVNKLSSLPNAVLYALSAAIEKSFSFVTIPLMAAFLKPSEYGNYDIAVVAADLVVLIVGLGMAEQLIRFVSTSNSDAGKRQIAGEILGCAVVATSVFLAAVLLISERYADLVNLQLELVAFRIVLAGACLSALIELPLAWLRLQDDAYAFLKFVLVRTLCQVASIVVVLTSGYGAEGLLVANGVIMGASTLWLFGSQIRKTPVKFSYSRFQQLARYGFPVLGAMLCMFFLGNASRLFLGNTVSAEMVGNFGLATRFAMIVAFVIYPLELWWLPKRIPALRHAAGLELSAQVFGVGVSLLLLAGLGVCLLVPVFILELFPPGYSDAVKFLPWIALILGLGAVAGMLEVGSYARENGYRILAIDFSAAFIAVLGFVLLIPQWGVYGAMVAMGGAQLVRISGYLIDGVELAPIHYPWRSSLLCLALVGLIISLVPADASVLLRVGWALGGSLTLIAVLFATDLVPWPLTGLGDAVAQASEQAAAIDAARLDNPEAIKPG